MEKKNQSKKRKDLCSVDSRIEPKHHIDCKDEFFVSLCGPRTSSEKPTETIVHTQNNLQLEQEKSYMQTLEHIIKRIVLLCGNR